MKPAYAVVWPRPLVERTIAGFVVRAMEDGTGFSAITAAMLEIDHRLSARPAEAGESRDGGDRILFAPPLVVTYRTREADRIVDILRAQYMPRRSPP